MTKVYLLDDVSNFLKSLGEGDWLEVITELHLLSLIGPDDLAFCDYVGHEIWEYRYSLGSGRYALLLFFFEDKSSSYVVLHGFRAGIEGTTRSDLREARRRRKAKQ